MKELVLRNSMRLMRKFLDCRASYTLEIMPIVQWFVLLRQGCRKELHGYLVSLGLAC